MRIEQIYTGCLAHGAYYIESKGVAAVIDPLREMTPYIDRASKSSASIRYIFETHFHADFVSGHIDLAKKTGATIVFGPGAKTEYNIHNAKDGERFRVGELSIEALHTPGHTPESTCYLLYDASGRPHALFSGDTLFIGDVGRPDLAQKATGLTQDDLAGWLFDSLRSKIMPLPDDVIVYPAHGAGSACGKNMSKETWDTLGNQKATNYALRKDMTREEFIREVTDGLLPPPQYFAQNVAMNREGYEQIDRVITRGNNPLSSDEFEALANNTGALLLDVRPKEDFVKGFIPNSIFIGLDGQFAPWVGTLITDINQPILIIAPEGKAAEAVTRLARVGYDNTIGYLSGGIQAWIQAGKETDRIISINTSEFKSLLQNDEVDHILDVRKPSEYQAEHLESAQNFPLAYINLHMEEIRREQTYFIHCRSGYRSTIAASILRARGFSQLVNVMAAFDSFSAEGLPVTQYICPSTIKN